MALTIVDAGRATLAKAIKDKNVMLAVGSGQAAWTQLSNTPSLSGTETALVAPVAGVRPAVKDFVVPNAAGTIEAPDGSKWSISATPTKYLYLSFVLGFQDGPSEVLKELGLYLDPTYAAAVGAGQTYIPWASVTNAGNLLALERIAPLERAGVRQTIVKLITF
jgi:hypothetical protein